MLQRSSTHPQKNFKEKSGPGTLYPDDKLFPKRKENPTPLFLFIIEDGCVGLGPRKNALCVADVIMEWKRSVARKIRELVKDLLGAGFSRLPGSGKGSHRKFTHENYPGAVTLSGQDTDDAKKYQEKQVKRAIEEVQK